MKEIFFRIIELKTHQILLERSFQEDEKCPYTLVVTFYHDGVKITQSFGYFIEEHRDEVFADYTDKQAQEIVDGVVAILSNDAEEEAEDE